MASATENFEGNNEEFGEFIPDSHHHSRSGSDSGEPTSPATVDPELELELQAEDIDQMVGYLQEDESWKSKYAQPSPPVTFEAGSESTSNPVEDADKPKPHFSKLHFDPKLSQSKRRTLTLEWQKKRRDHILDKIRHLEGDSGVSDNETDDDVLDFLESSKAEVGAEPMQTTTTTHSARKRKPNNKRRPRHAPTGVMLSEWLLTKPEDFEEKWLGVLCPGGKRTIVVASRGKTKVYSRREDFLGVINTLLPGGRKGSYSIAGNRGRGVTILDCIWSADHKVFYVLDLICWNSHSCINCDTEYRQFFLTSKFSENQDLMTVSQLNSIPFIPLQYFSPESLPSILNSHPSFPDPIDGLLFFHKEGFYIPEVNPLCVWVRLADVSMRLGLEPSPELLAKETKRRHERGRWSGNHHQQMHVEYPAVSSTGGV